MKSFVIMFLICHFNFTMAILPDRGAGRADQKKNQEVKKMAHVYQLQRKDGSTDPVWRIQYRDWAGRKRKVKGHLSKSQTNKLATDLESRHALARKGEIEPPCRKRNNIAFETTVQEYLAWGDAQGGRGGRPWGKGHADTRHGHMRWWKEKLNPSTLADLEGCHPAVEKHLRKLMEEGRSGRTVAQYMETITAFCSWCVDREYFKENPLRKLGKIDRTPKTYRRAMTLEEVQRLFEVLPVERRFLYEVAMCTGLRANEMRNLTVDHLDIGGSGLRLEAKWTKNRKSGFQPLPADLVRRLVDFSKTGVVKQKYERNYLRCDAKVTPPENPLLYVLNSPGMAFDDDIIAADIPKVTPEGKLDFHSLRVAYTTFVIESGANVKEAQTLLRHSTPDLTMNVYARTRKGRLNEVVEGVGKAVGDAISGLKDRETQPKARDGRAPKPGQLPATSGQDSAPSVPPRGSEEFVDDCNDRSYVAERPGFEPGIQLNAIWQISNLLFIYLFNPTISYIS